MILLSAEGSNCRLILLLLFPARKQEAEALMTKRSWNWICHLQHAAGEAMPEVPSERRSIWVQIKLDGTGFASDPEFDLRYTLEDAVIEGGMGSREGAGSGGGWMDFSFGVENIERAEAALAFVVTLLNKYQVPSESYRLEIFRQFDTVCDDLPDFQPGNCLCFRFSDGDYGAAIVLQPGQRDQTTPQIGKPPAGNPADEILVGVLDYKESERPELSLFEQRNWLLDTHDRWKGQPYLVWLDCFGGVEVELVGQTSLRVADPTECSFHLSWEDLPSHVIYEKAGHHMPGTAQASFPVFAPGTGLSYQFADGAYGAALVLKNARSHFKNVC